MKAYIFILITMLITLSSCTVEPKEIAYGKDHCHYCDMTVVDKTHAAQYVTKKGKAYMFDAIECLVNKLIEDKSEPKMAFILVADYNSPGTLINATDATYLISEKIKSPMGANLSAFSTLEDAKKIKDGKLFNWKELNVKFSK